MPTRVRVLPAAAVLCLAVAISAYAQDPPRSSAGSPPANLAYVEGGVELVHEGLTERADPPVLLLDGDGIRTRNGRAEVVFADGTLLHVDSDAEIEMLSPDRIRLLAGRLLLRISAAATRPYHVDTPTATVRLESRGEYHVIADPRRGLDVSVARGLAEIDDGSQRMAVRAGESAWLAAPGARALYRSFNSARWDAFAQWAAERSHGFTTAQSATYLPSELRPYGLVFDQYGRWDHVAPHGYVWFPSVDVAWRPYFDGWWGHTRYGWTWYGHDRWAWPTHHYGRWGFNGAWFWMPTRVWGPAWVSWGYTGGYVSWAPLGWDGLPSIALWPRRDHPAFWPNYSPWRAWTIVPRHHFGPRWPVRAHAIDGDRLDEGARRAMVVGNRGPGTPGGAIPRSTVSTLAGVTGNVRRDTPSVDRPGAVRRPGAQVPGIRSGAPAAASAPSTPATDPAPVPPEYRPPSGIYGAVPRAGDGSTGETRRGAVRYPRPYALPSTSGESSNAGRSSTGRPSGEDASGSDVGARRGGGSSGRDNDGSRDGRSRAVPRETPRSATPAERGGRSSERAGAGSEGGARGGAAGPPAARPSGGEGGARRRPQ